MYSHRQMEYIDSVEGAAHMSAVEIIGELEAALVAAGNQRPAVTRCHWENPAYPFGPWGADCGALWEFEVNDPADDAGNPVKYCPNCGLPVLFIKGQSS